MATQTLIGTVSDAATDASQYARIVRVIRNMDFIRFCDKGNITVPVRTETHPSPVKQSASNRQPGQSHTRTAVGGALNNEMAAARYLTDDLADHVFGRFVSTDLARDILCEFVCDGFVHVFEGTHPCHRGDALDPDSDDVQYAIKQAFEDADVHDCIRLDTGSGCEEPEPSPTVTKGKGKQTNSKSKGKRKQKGYSFKWTAFPKEPIDEDELVDFLNEITDRAFRFAQPKLVRASPKPKNRFATQGDKNRALSLSYEPDGEDMRPDFLLLPAQAFLDDFKTVDPRYLNFTAARLVGEAKNKDLAAGVEQVQRYARGLKRAQPWVHYVLAMVMTRDKAVFIRGEGSGAERLDLILSNGRGCIEFIRILLGLALAEDVDLGQNPDIELKNETRTCEVHNLTLRCVTSNNFSSSTTASRLTATANTESIVATSSAVATSKAASDALPVSSRTRSASAASKRGTLLLSNTHPGSSRTRSASAAFKRGSSLPSNATPSSSCTRDALLVRRRPSATSSISSKRTHSEIGDDGCQERQRQKKRKMTEAVVMQDERVVFSPQCVYGHTCQGLLFTSSSIRGRGTTVFCVLDLEDVNRRLALKMSWQDLEHVSDHVVVIKRLKETSHPNIVVPLENFHAEREGQICTTLGAIRGFLEEQIALLKIENRVLNISTSELKRPVKYFWGIHDFVRGLRGALLGHQFLTSAGILHRDISENNIVLGVYPWEERGYLIDFDMAVLQDAEESSRVSESQPTSPLPQSAEHCITGKPVQSDEAKHVKAIRTGTFPYMSFNVLFGERHTHFDDVESFLYVLLLFFFSYAGPLSKEELQDAHEKGFVRPTGCGRLPHIRSWPQKFCEWADGEANNVGESKYFHVTHPGALKYLEGRAEIKDCLENNWPDGLQTPIRSLLRNTLKAFRESMKGGVPRTEVSHAQFIQILDEWLVEHSDLEDKYSNCPDFEDFRNNLKD